MAGSVACELHVHEIRVSMARVIEILWVVEHNPQQRRVNIDEVFQGSLAMQKSPAIGRGGGKF